MGKSKQSAPSAPATPKPQSEYYYVDGNLESSRTQGKTPTGEKGWMTNVYRSPQEQAIEKQSTEFISGLIPQAQQAFNVSPEGIEQYKQAYIQPQMRALNNAYDQTLGAATNSATSSGLRNSVGFENYRTNQLEKNRAEGAADIAANAELMGYQLPSMRLAPFADAFNLYNAALSGEQASQSNNAQMAQQGSQMANNFAMQNYQNELARFQNQGQSQKNGGNFFGWLIGKDSLY